MDSRQVSDHSNGNQCPDGLAQGVVDGPLSFSLRYFEPVFPIWLKQVMR